jgi:hypothetical protein
MLPQYPLRGNVTWAALARGGEPPPDVRFRQPKTGREVTTGSRRALAWHAAPRRSIVRSRMEPISVMATRAAALELSAPNHHRKMRWPRAQSVTRALVYPSPSSSLGAESALFIAHSFEWMRFASWVCNLSIKLPIMSDCLMVLDGLKRCNASMRCRCIAATRLSGREKRSPTSCRYRASLPPRRYDLAPLNGNATYCTSF